jgi:putative ABC transport system substrate-binding protein
MPIGLPINLWSAEMRRREFIAGLGGAAALPVVARAQQPATPVIGLLIPGTPDRWQEIVAGINRGLSDTGYVDGRNLAIEYRWAEDRYERLPALADDLVRHRVSVIVTAGSTASALAAKNASKSTPIVFALGSDPVEAGLVVSLNKPGGNLTGVTIRSTEVTGKRFEMLHEVVPAATLIAHLVNPTNPAFAGIETRELEVAAKTFGVRLLVVNARDQSDFERAFATMIRERAGGLVIGGDPLFLANRDQLVTLAVRHRVPALSPWREATAAGGLMSYGTDFPDLWRRVGVYAGRILSGDKPEDLPVEQVTKMQLAINMKTAQALGLTFPLTLLARADEVIE